jgi:hypothetical protein
MSKLRSMVGISMIVVLLIGLFPLTAGAAPTPQEGNARVRFVHASFDAPSLDAFVDGAPFAAGVRGETGYQDVPAGNHTFSWRAAGEAADRAAVTLTVAAGQRVTIAAINTYAALEAKAFTDDVTAPARNRAKIKVIHAVADGPAINLTYGDVAVASGLQYGEASEVGQAVAGYHDINVTSADGAVLATEATRPTNEDRTYTIFVVGSAAAGAFRLAVYESTVLPPEPTTQFMFGNFAQGLDAINVHINKEPAPLYSGVIFASVQEPFAAGLGPYLIELYQPGTGPDNGGVPLASGTFDVGANQNVLFVAQGTKDELQVGAYVADLSPLPPQSSRLTVINLAVGNPPFQVERMEGGTLIDSVDVFQTASTVVPGGGYNVRFKDLATGAMMMEQGGVQMPSGTATLLVAFDDDPADPLINALSFSNTQVVQYAAVRWAHLNVFGPPVDIYMNGVPVMTSLVYKMKTEYMLYEPMVYTLTVFPVGADPATAQPLDSQTMELTGANFPRTIFVYGQPDEAKLGIAPDSLESLPAGMARMRFINASIDVTGVAVYNSTDNSQIVGNIVFGQSSDNFNVPAGVYSFNFLADFGAVTNLQGLTLEEGKIYTIILAGIATESPGPETIVLVETP